MRRRKTLSSGGSAPKMADFKTTQHMLVINNSRQVTMGIRTPRKLPKLRAFDGSRTRIEQSRTRTERKYIIAHTEFKKFNRKKK